VIQDRAGNDTTGWSRSADSFTSTSSLELATTTSITTASLTGTGNANLTGNNSANTLIGNDGANVITGLGGADRLTGGGGTDTFSYTNNNQSQLAAFDVITDFNSAEDKIDITRLGASFATSVAAKNLTGTAVTALTQTGISKVLTNSTFGAADAAAVFQFNGNYYLAVNDGNQGFQAATDSIIQLGSTTNPNIIPTAVQVF
jgi:Ca2+-binding RTX toxin-like protein